MRILFMGASELGWECCRFLIESRHNIIGIFSIPEEFRISWSKVPVVNVRFKNFEALAGEFNIPLVYINKKMNDPEYIAVIRSLHPDIIIAIGWYYMVPRSIRNLVPMGAIGIHTSLLPKYRGGAPLVWSIINGEHFSGASLFYFEDGVDSGDIIGQVKFEISLDDDIANLVCKSTNASIDLLRTHVPLLENGKAARIPQDHCQATFVQQRRPEDGLIDWTVKNAWQAYNWIRAQTRPYPGAFTFLRNKRVILWKARHSSMKMDQYWMPGTIVTDLPDVADAFGVMCADNNLLEIHEIGLENGMSMDGKSFITRNSINTGMMFSLEKNYV